MTKKELLEKLKELESGDPEIYHRLADEVLLDYIDDSDITNAFLKIERWYA